MTEKTYTDNSALAAQINAELDRLEWSSETAPPGEPCVDAFPTTSPGLVALAYEYGTHCYDAEAVLCVLWDLEPPIGWSALVAALAPYRQDA